MQGNEIISDWKHETVIQTQYSFWMAGMRGSLMARVVKFGSVKSTQKMLILFLPSCKTCRQESKVTENHNQRLQWKLRFSGFVLSNKFEVKLVFLSKRRLCYVWCKKILEVSQKCISKKTTKCPGGLQQMLFLHRTHLPWRSW